MYLQKEISKNDTVLVKSREMTDRNQTLPWWMWGEDDRNKNTLAPLVEVRYFYLLIDFLWLSFSCSVLIFLWHAF
jgi:hypothetical protein